MPATVRICADDAFACRSIDDGVHQLVEAGIVTEVAAFVNFTRPVPELLDPARIGLHLCLTSGRPLSDPKQVPSLVESSGRLRTPTPAGRADMHDALTSRLAQLAESMDASDILSEAQAQLDAFGRFFGRQPAFVALHHDLDAVGAFAGKLGRAELRGRAEEVRTGAAAAYSSAFVNPGERLSDYAQRIVSLVSRARKASAAAGGRPAIIACHPAADGESVDPAFTVYRQERQVELAAWFRAAGAGAFRGGRWTSDGWVFGA